MQEKEFNEMKFRQAGLRPACLKNPPSADNPQSFRSPGASAGLAFRIF
jgi:hypothetical protein